jgi:hypothetical protein
MKTISLFLVLFVAAPTAVQGEPLTRESLEGTIFESMGVQRGEPSQLLLKFNRSGARFLLFRNGNEEKVNEYGETIAVKLGESFSLTEHQGGFEFLPLPKPLDRNGWLLKSDADARSFGGSLSTQYAIVLILNGSELRFVEPDPNFDPKLPPTDPTYQRIAKLIAKANPLQTHKLVAKTAAGEASQPFPKSTSAIFFEWKRSPQNAAEPLEIRWIAADTGGVAPKNHLISSSKSEPGKAEGAFILSRPTQGFPPGKYRLELWQDGKLIYAEDFSIQ